VTFVDTLPFDAARANARAMAIATIGCPLWESKKAGMSRRLEGKVAIITRSAPRFAKARTLASFHPVGTT
jgi:hypothetical protein